MTSDFRWSLRPGGELEQLPRDRRESVAPGPDLAELVAPGAAEPWDLPTVATPVYTGAEKYPGAELVSQRYAPEVLDPLPPLTARRTTADGGQSSGVPDDASPASSDIDVLFGDKNFVDYSGEPMIAPLASAVAEFRDDRASRLLGTARAADPLDGIVTRTRRNSGRSTEHLASDSGSRGELVRPRARPARIPGKYTMLLVIAACTVIVLALWAIFLLGTRIADGAQTAALAAIPAPIVTSLPTLPLPADAPPLPPGDYRWDELAGGECVTPFESAWQESFTVVDCSESHEAQLVARDVLSQTPNGAAGTYPGIDGLQATVTGLCTSPAVIDYALAGASNDLQLVASFPADDADWASGNHTYYCFASSVSGAPWQGSIAQRPAG